jgi:hypothetical protein
MGFNRAGGLAGPEWTRASAWGAIDREIVEHALAVPMSSEKEPSVEGSGVHGVGQLWNIGSWDFSWTSLK